MLFPDIFSEIGSKGEKTVSGIFIGKNNSASGRRHGVRGTTA